MDTSNSSSSPIGQVPPELVRRQLETILSRETFRNSNRLGRFLRYVVEQSFDGNNALTERDIGIGVFDREQDYDTRADPVVRVGARQLRFKLAEYYAQEGAADEIVIHLPKGGYAPHFELRPAARPLSQPDIEPIEIDSETADAPGAESPHRHMWLYVAAILLFGVGIWCGLVFLRTVRRTPRSNMEAQELYLKGRYYWSKRTPEDLNRAVDYFTQSVVKDPRYAQAYSGLADTYNLLSEYTVMPYQEAFKRARAAAKTAIQIDDTLPEAHNSLAFASFWGAWDSVTAEREFRRALQLDPNYVTAHHWYATFLMSVGQVRGALAEIDRAQMLDPSSNSILADKGLILLNAGQVNAAGALLEEVSANDPQFLSPHRYLAQLYVLEKRYPSYLSESRKVALLLHDTEALSVVQAGEKGFAKCGVVCMLQGMLRAQEASSTDEGIRYYRLAATCALLKNNSKAVQYLRLAFDEHDINLAGLTVDPCFAQMREQPAFREFVKRVGVTDSTN